MPNTNPTIVSASLSDKELQDSINKMVANFDKGLQTMLEHSNEYVGKIQESLQKIGNTNFGAKGSNDGGVAKQTKAQNEFTDAVEKNVAARDKQIKKNQETAMSFDQIAAALDKARQTVRDFNIGRQGGLPSADDYKRYEQALARIVEYNDKLKQSALGMAFSNEKAFSFDAKRNIKDMFAVDDRLKQLNKYYAEQEKLSQKATQDEERQRQKRVAAMEKESAAQKKMVDDQYKLSFARTMKIPTDQLDLAQAKLERLQALLRDMRERGILSNTQIASTEAEIRKLEQIIGQVNTTQQQTTQSAQRYTEEIRKQAAAIRETQTWKEKGYAIVGGDSYYDPESSKASRKDVLSLEEQILKNTQQREEAEKKVSNVLKEEVETLNVARNGFKLDNSSQADKTVKSIGAHKEAAEAAAKETNYLKEQVASLLEVEEREIKTANATSSSYAQLAQYLKHLQSAYQRLGADRIAKGEGTDIADEIQRTQRAMQKLQKTMSRPISFAAAMKGDEKTLDDIAYKMQRLRSYRQGIDLTKPNAANEIRQVDEALAKLQKDADKWMSKSNDMIKSNTALGRSWNYMKNRLAFYFTVGASTSFIKNLIEVRSQYEMNERALGILINSAERGTQIFSELSQMALVSPYTLIELSSAAKQLTAYDVAAKDVVDTTRRLADMAAAVGIPMERLTYALGQIKAYGYLNSRDARMFANAGIPLVKQLSDYYTEIEGKLVSTADIYDRIKKKAIDYNDVMQVIVKMTDQGGKFFDFQAKMADTLKVRLANLTLAWNNMLNDIGASQQGILTSGIGALRTLFLHWKDIYTVANQLALTLGSLKAAQLLYWAAVHGTNKAIALEVVLGQKLATTLKSVAISLRTLLTSPATWFFVLSAAITSAGMALWDAGEATKEFNKSIRDNASDSLKNLQEFEKQYSSIRDELYKKEKDEKGKETLVPQNTLDSNEAKKAWDAVRNEIELTSQASNEYIGYLISIGNIYDRLRAGFSIIDDIKAVKAELEKAGEEEIKMTEGMDGWWNAHLLPDGWIKNLKDYEEELDNVKEKWGDIEKARDMVGEARHANQIKGDVVLNHGKANAILYEDVTDMDVALVKFQKDIEVTTRSIIDFINGRGWSKDTNKITEVFKQVEQQMIQAGNLTAQESSLLQLEIERGRSKAIKDALEKRIADEQNLLKYAAKESAKIEIQERINTLNEEYKEYETYQGRGRVLWSNYTKWMKEQHLFEMQQMFKGMTSQQIAELDFSKGNYADWAKSTAEEYAKTHGLSYKDTFDLLENYVKKANKWSIFIPLTISTEDDKTIYKQLEEYDKNADAAWKTMQRLDKRIQQLRKKGAKEIVNSENVGVTDLSLISEDDKELTKAIEERTQAQKDYNEAVAKGGESKKENAADRKAAKQAESELAKALKDELSTIEKVRSIYKDLTNEGMSHANAVERATRGWDETVNAINRVLQKNGLQKLDLSKFAGIENPRELVNMLQSQLNALVGRTKPSEIKELQTKIQTLSVDADKYDLTKITKGLNSELDRLKEEYELAVSLDADPELGSMFADWMGIDMDNLPRTAEEYAKRYTDELNSKLKEYKADLELPNLLNITDDDLRELQKRVGTGNITQKYVDDITKGVKAVRDVFSKELTSAISNYGKLLDKYGDYVVKVRRIEEEAATERKDLVMRFGNEQQKSKGLKLHTEILEEEDPVARQKLVDDLENLTNEVSKANPVALKINASIGNSENEKLAQASFEEFQKSREWVIATGDLATLSRSALGMLIREIEKYKKTAKNLTPKQIKAINNTLKQLKREVRKNNPFAILKNTIEDSKERMAGYQSDMDAVMRKIVEYEKKIGDRKGRFYDRSFRNY